MFLSRFYKKIKVKDKYVIFHSLVRKFKFVAPDFIGKLETLNSQKIAKAHLQFYGGEPLCNWPIVKYCIAEKYALSVLDRWRKPHSSTVKAA